MIGFPSLILCTFNVYSSDSDRKPVALIRNVTIIPPSTRSKNDTNTTIYTITLIDTSNTGPVCNFEAVLGAWLILMNQQVLLRPGTPVIFKFKPCWPTMSSNRTIT